MIELIELKAVFIPIWFALFFIGERLARVATPPVSKARLWRNGGLWAINLILSPAFVLPVTAWAAAHSPWTRPGWLAGGAGLATDFILLDLWVYWVHRAYHEIPLMWRLHRPHHRDEHLDTTSAARFHFGEVALSATLRVGLIVALAIPFAHVVLFETLLLAATIFHHSNLRLPGRFEAALSRVIITPSIHWVHHHALKTDTNSNYGAVLSVWDRLFGSRSRTRRSPDMKIGVEGLEDRPFLGLLIAPFTRRVR